MERFCYNQTPPPSPWQVNLPNPNTPSPWVYPAPSPFAQYQAPVMQPHFNQPPPPQSHGQEYFSSGFRRPPYQPQQRKQKQPQIVKRPQQQSKIQMTQTSKNTLRNVSSWKNSLNNTHPLGKALSILASWQVKLTPFGQRRKSRSCQNLFSSQSTPKLLPRAS